MTQGVVAVDATSLDSHALLSSQTSSSETTMSPRSTQTMVVSNFTARVDGENKHPFDATLTEGDTDESPQFDLLKEDASISRRYHAVSRLTKDG